MSQALLRRLRLIGDGSGAAGGPARSYSFYSLFRQDPSNDGPSRKHQNQVLRYHHTEGCLLQGPSIITSQKEKAHMKVVNISYQNHPRTMSILTDLLRRKKKPEEEDEEASPAEEAKTMQLFIEEPKQLTEEEIEAKRNLSRLNPYHQRLVHGQVPYTEPAAWFHHTVKYKQRMFGRYGESSGVNPGILWPTREQLQERIEYESFCNPFTIQEMVEKKRALRQKEKEAIDKRIKEVEVNMSKLEDVKRDLARRLQAKEDEANVAKERREKLIEDVRRHFGYTVDPRDERFQELLAKKEKEQKKSMKEARKMERQQRVLEKLQGKSKEESKAKEAKPKKVAVAENKDD